MMDCVFTADERLLHVKATRGKPACGGIYRTRMVVGCMEELYYSTRFTRPFIQVLSSDLMTNELALVRLRAQELEDRLSLSVAHATIADTLAGTGDLDLGLKAGRLITPGSGGALDYAALSAPTMREAIAVIARYARLYSDALEVRLELCGNRAFLRLDNRVRRPRTIADFTVGAWYSTYLRDHVRAAHQVECWFAHAAPLTTGEYARTFPGAKLRFGADCDGFAFDADFLAARPSGAEPMLHSLLCELVERMVGELPTTRDVTAKVRELVSKKLPEGRASASGVAHELRISRRTLSRKLEDEGTTFRTQLDDVRRDLGLYYVGCRSTPLTEIGFHLGFSHVQAFHRAFKRWTGETPEHYRQRAREKPPDL